MNTTFGEAGAWAEREFGGARLGDRRRTRRLVKVAAGLARCPSGTLPSALRHWKELKGAYRLFSNQEAAIHPALLETHCQADAGEVPHQPGEYLLIEDRTCLDYSGHRATRGLGRIGNDRGMGFLLHTTLAVKVEAEAAVRVVGLLGQSCWARTGSSARAKKELLLRLTGQSSPGIGALGGEFSKKFWACAGVGAVDLYRRSGVVIFMRCLSGAVRRGWNLSCGRQFAQALAGEDRSVLKRSPVRLCWAILNWSCARAGKRRRGPRN